jgi:MFS family permease
MVFYQDRAGLELSTILWVQTYSTALRATLDVPFGALADRTSRRLCLVAGMVLPAIASALLVWRPTLAVIVVAETLFATGTALRSGADSALLYDCLKDAGRLDAYPRAESRGQGAAALASGTTAVVGGLLAARELTLPYVATALVTLAGAAVALRLRIDPPATRARGACGAAARPGATSPRLVRSIALAASPWRRRTSTTTSATTCARFGVPIAAFGVVLRDEVASGRRDEERGATMGARSRATIVMALPARRASARYPLRTSASGARHPRGIPDGL